jgi:hypothetical protein
LRRHAGEELDLTTEVAGAESVTFPMAVNAAELQQIAAETNP